MTHIIFGPPGTGKTHKLIQKVEEYIKKWNNRDNKKFEEIDKRVKLLGIENVKEKEMYKYKDVIKDESGIIKHLNTIKLLKSDEYLKSEMEERMKNTMKVKMLNDINSKILLIRKIEEDNKIDFEPIITYGYTDRLSNILIIILY